MAEDGNDFSDAMDWVKEHVVPRGWREDFQRRLELLVEEYLDCRGADSLSRGITLKNNRDDERRLAGYEPLIQEILAIRTRDPMWIREQEEQRDWRQQNPPRERITRELRLAIYERDGHKCLKCGATEKLSLDHIVPAVHGGATTPGNLRTLCGSCNSAKGDRLET